MSRPMPGRDGKALDLFDLTKKAHNPGRRKKQRAFYRDAALIRGYRKLPKEGAGRDFDKKKRRAEAAEAAPEGGAPRGKKRFKKSDPFKKERAARAAADEERRRQREEAERQKGAA
eukprot:CAMPEP_0119282184 /NCGR_PEP_ID=MMETSP1329-20130426/26219_1 /TAXON_ID=114041 /ORGANISM="Genus nov. species nov., Strain RCC1024" /LENGTH=115 /DNA_ID=CAMNT_0007282831 /DNA_START=149 /DNA_END=493 /DNA_ORIENTATION=+